MPPSRPQSFTFTFSRQAWFYTVHQSLTVKVRNFHSWLSLVSVLYLDGGMLSRNNGSEVRHHLVNECCITIITSKSEGVLLFGYTPLFSWRSTKWACAEVKNKKASNKVILTSSSCTNAQHQRKRTKILSKKYYTGLTRCKVVNTFRTELSNEGSSRKRQLVFVFDQLFGKMPIPTVCPTASCWERVRHRWMVYYILLFHVLKPHRVR